jgi:uncharacterized DUF497 family protein
MLDFEWDSENAAGNVRKHGVSFAEAATVFGDPRAITFPDPDHSDDEEREITVGWSARNRMLIASHTERDGRVRIISARRVTKAERDLYETR